MERDHRLQGDIVCPTVWPCYQDTTMTRVDDWLEKPPLFTCPMKCPAVWSPGFHLPNQIIRPPLWLQSHLCAWLFCESHLHTMWQESLREWSLPYTLDSLWYIWWSTFPLCWQVHICTTGLIVTPPPSSPVTTATVFTFPSETSYTSIPVVGGILYRSFKSYKR